MKKMTPKQEMFCLAFIEIGCASAAYRKAYNAEKMKPATINRKAAYTLSLDKIRARIDFLQANAAEEATLTLAEHLNDLKVLRDFACGNGKYGPAVQAEIARGKAQGFYVNRIKLENLPIVETHDLSGE